MKYYAMINGEQRGPYELNELAEAGVRPSTYVWCKGMADWEKAEDVADVCRMMRNRIHDLMHPGSDESLMKTPETVLQKPDGNFPQTQMPSRFGRYIDDPSQLPTIEEIEDRRDTGRAPMNMLALAILSAVLFFPLTGIVAIMYAVKSRRAWIAAEEEERNGDQTQDSENRVSSSEWRKLSHEYCQGAKMWTGITFFIGLIFYAFLMRSVL